MDYKRIIVCLDVKDGRTTKGVKFLNNVDIGDPVEMAKVYCQQGVDELVFYDIMASSENRSPLFDLIKKVKQEVSVPFCVGGGIANIQDIQKIIELGAQKVSINSPAVKNPTLINEAATRFGSKAIALGIDAQADTSMSSGYRIYIQGGRVATELDAREWAIEAEKRGAGEIVLNSIDGDGTREGYDLILTELISSAVQIPVVASGGAGTPEHLVEALTIGKASAALVASIVHSGEYTVADLKEVLKNNGVAVR